MMNVRIRPGGIVLFCLMIAALVYRLLYTLLWAREDDKGPLMSLFGKKTSIVLAPSASPPAVAPPATGPAQGATSPTDGFPVADSVPASAKRMSDWLVFAPISIPKGTPLSNEEKLNKLLDSVGLPDEGTLDPKPDDSGSVNGVTHKWIAVKEVDLNFIAVANKSLGITGENVPEDVVAYAVTTVEMPGATRNATLYLGSDDGVSVWLNGQRIHRNPVSRGVRLGDDKISGLDLKAGRNVFVFKVAQAAALWGLSAALDVPK